MCTKKFVPIYLILLIIQTCYTSNSGLFGNELNTPKLNLNFGLFGSGSRGSAENHHQNAHLHQRNAPIPNEIHHGSKNAPNLNLQFGLGGSRSENLNTHHQNWKIPQFPQVSGSLAGVIDGAANNIQHFPEFLLGGNVHNNARIQHPSPGLLGAAGNLNTPNQSWKISQVPRVSGDLTGSISGVAGGLLGSSSQRSSKKLNRNAHLHQTNIETAARIPNEIHNTLKNTPNLNLHLGLSGLAGNLNTPNQNWKFPQVPQVSGSLMGAANNIQKLPDLLLGGNIHNNAKIQHPSPGLLGSAVNLNTPNQNGKIPQVPRISEGLSGTINGEINSVANNIQQLPNYLLGRNVHNNGRMQHSSRENLIHLNLQTLSHSQVENIIMNHLNSSLSQSNSNSGEVKLNFYINPPKNSNVTFVRVFVKELKSITNNLIPNATIAIKTTIFKDKTGKLMSLRATLYAKIAQPTNAADSSLGLGAMDERSGRNVHDTVKINLSKTNYNYSNVIRTTLSKLFAHSSSNLTLVHHLHLEFTLFRKPTSEIRGEIVHQVRTNLNLLLPNTHFKIETIYENRPKISLDVIFEHPHKSQKSNWHITGKTASNSSIGAKTTKMAPRKFYLGTKISPVMSQQKIEKNLCSLMKTAANKLMNASFSGHVLLEIIMLNNKNVEITPVSNVNSKAIPIFSAETSTESSSATPLSQKLSTDQSVEYEWINKSSNGIPVESIENENIPNTPEAVTNRSEESEEGSTTLHPKMLANEITTESKMKKIVKKPISRKKATRKATKENNEVNASIENSEEYSTTPTQNSAASQESTEKKYISSSEEKHMTATTETFSKPGKTTEQAGSSSSAEESEKYSIKPTKTSAKYLISPTTQNSAEPQESSKGVINSSSEEQKEESTTSNSKILPNEVTTEIKTKEHHVVLNTHQITLPKKLRLRVAVNRNTKENARTENSEEYSSSTSPTTQNSVESQEATEETYNSVFKENVKSLIATTENSSESEETTEQAMSSSSAERSEKYPIKPIKNFSQYSISPAKQNSVEPQESSEEGQTEESTPFYSKILPNEVTTESKIGKNYLNSIKTISNQQIPFPRRLRLRISRNQYNKENTGIVNSKEYSSSPSTSQESTEEAYISSSEEKRVTVTTESSSESEETTEQAIISSSAEENEVYPMKPTKNSGEYSIPSATQNSVESQESTEDSAVKREKYIVKPTENSEEYPVATTENSNESELEVAITTERTVSSYENSNEKEVNVISSNSQSPKISEESRSSESQEENEQYPTTTVWENLAVQNTYLRQRNIRKTTSIPNKIHISSKNTPNYNVANNFEESTTELPNYLKKSAENNHLIGNVHGLTKPQHKQINRKVQNSNIHSRKIETHHQRLSKNNENEEIPSTVIPSLPNINGSFRVDNNLFGRISLPKSFKKNADHFLENSRAKKFLGIHNEALHRPLSISENPEAEKGHSQEDKTKTKVAQPESELSKTSSSYDKPPFPELNVKKMKSQQSSPRITKTTEAPAKTNFFSSLTNWISSFKNKNTNSYETESEETQTTESISTSNVEQISTSSAKSERNTNKLVVEEFEIGNKNKNVAKSTMDREKVRVLNISLIEENMVKIITTAVIHEVEFLPANEALKIVLRIIPPENITLNTLQHASKKLLSNLVDSIPNFKINLETKFYELDSTNVLVVQIDIKLFPLSNKANDVVVSNEKEVNIDLSKNDFESVEDLVVLLKSVLKDLDSSNEHSVVFDLEMNPQESTERKIPTQSTTTTKQIENKPFQNVSDLLLEI